jgi:hypothetical protein
MTEINKCAILALSVFAMAPWAHAQQAPAKEQQDIARFKYFEPTYFAWGQATGDEHAWRVHYSFRYLLNIAPDEGEQPGPYDIFFKMTGEFDFYAATRDSGPVINRISNPGVHLRKNYVLSKEDDSWQLKWWEVTAEHRSNGQVTEVRSAQDAERAQRAYDAGNYAYFDSVSRGSNYVRPQIHWVKYIQDGPFSGDLSTYLSAKLYATKDSDITWGPLANKGVNIANYDLINGVMRWSSKRWKLCADEASGPVEAAIDWTLGSSGLKTQSVNVDYMHPCRMWGVELPLFVRYHVGPMNSLSNYTQFVHAWWIGIKLYPG